MSGDRTRKLHPAVGISGALVFCLLEIWPLMLSSGDLYLMDHLTLDAPMRLFAAQRFWAGESLIWHDSLLCGVSPIAEGQTGLFYPGFALYLLHPFVDANDFYVSLHLILMTLTLYLCVRKRTGSDWGAMLSSMLLIHSQLLKIAHGNSGGLAVLALLPLAIWLVEHAWEGKGWSYPCVAVVNSLMLLTGVPNAAAMAYLTQVVFVLFLFWDKSGSKVEDVHLAKSMPRGVKAFSLGAGSVFRWSDARWLKLVRLLIWMYIVPVFLSFVQILPLYFYFRESNRSDGGVWETVSERLVSPFFFFDTAYINPSMTGYASPMVAVESAWLLLFSLLLVLGVVFGRPRRAVIFWLGMMVLFYLAASNSSVLYLFHFVPVLNWFQWPQLYLVPGFFAALMLVAMGGKTTEAWIGRLPSWRAGGAILFTMGLAGWMSQDGYGKYLAFGDLYKEESRSLESGQPAWMTGKVWPYDHLYVICANDRQITVERLQSAMEFVPGNIHLLFGSRHPFQNEVLDTVSPGRMSDLYRCANERGPLAMLHVAQLAGVSDFTGFTDRTFADTDLIALGSNQRHHLRSFLGEGWIVHRTRLVTERDERLQMIASESFDPRREAILESPTVESLVDFDASAVGEAAFDEGVFRENGSGPNRDFVCRLSRPGMLVVPIRFNRWMQATVDSRPTEIHCVNHAFCGVMVPSGGHRVSIEYVPMDFYVGAVVSSASWILLMFMVKRRWPGRSSIDGADVL